MITTYIVKRSNSDIVAKLVNDIVALIANKEMTRHQSQFSIKFDTMQHLSENYARPLSRSPGNLLMSCKHAPYQWISRPLVYARYVINPFFLVGLLKEPEVGANCLISWASIACYCFKRSQKSRNKNSMPL